MGPSVRHEDLVARAVNRTPPFNEKGGGYRDALVWADVLDLVRGGHEVALVSADRAFAGADGQLALALLAEVEPLSGTVELVRDFSRWLIAELPWSVEDLASAVSMSQHSEFFDYYLKSDLQDALVPEFEDMGFRWAPYGFEIIEVRWDGGFNPVEGSVGPDGLTLVEYNLDQIVEFEADFPEGIEPESGWRASEPDAFHRVHVVGSAEMVVRIAVLFGGEFGFSVEQLSWHRADGALAKSVLMAGPDPNQLTLLDPPGANASV